MSVINENGECAKKVEYEAAYFDCCSKSGGHVSVASRKVVRIRRSIQRSSSWRQKVHLARVEFEWIDVIMLLKVAQTINKPRDRLVVARIDDSTNTLPPGVNIN